MRYRLLAVMTGLALGLAVFAAVPAVAAPPQQTQKLKLSGDPHVTGSNSLTLKATKIEPGTLELACFTFNFTGDLLDPGEGLAITPGSDSDWGPGFENVGTEPTSRRTLCVHAPGFLAEIADGNSVEKFFVRAHPGGSSSSFTVSSVTMTLTYA